MGDNLIPHARGRGGRRRAWGRLFCMGLTQQAVQKITKNIDFDNISNFLSQGCRIKKCEKCRFRQYSHFSFPGQSRKLAKISISIILLIFFRTRARCKPDIFRTLPVAAAVPKTHSLYNALCGVFLLVQDR
jgi:hypothetical protein